jgi:SAM-dependent methyltransferase
VPRVVKVGDGPAWRRRCPKRIAYCMRMPGAAVCLPAMAELYDTIGCDYRHLRRADPRIESAISRAVESATSLVNVGAGTGSYEPRDRPVVAVEPSLVMIRQRPVGSAPVVRATASALPFGNARFDVSLAVLTVHHWPDWRRGIHEMRRISRRIVLLTYDPDFDGFWLVNDYLPANRDIDRATMPSIAALRSELGRVRVKPVEIPHDCTDGFLGAYWRRPHAYLRSDVRAAISSFRKIPDVERGLKRLRADLVSGEWNRRYARLLGFEALDVGYRLIAAD